MVGEQEVVPPEVWFPLALQDGGKAKVKALKKGKEKVVEAPEEWSKVELGGEYEDDTSGEEAA